MLLDYIQDVGCAVETEWQFTRGDIVYDKITGSRATDHYRTQLHTVTHTHTHTHTLQNVQL